MWLAWLYWDPPREAFIVPILERPIFWYGILFVSGFILGCAVINPILTRFLNRSKHIASIDIAQWSLLIEMICESQSPLIKQLHRSFSSTIKQQICQLTSPMLTSSLKKQLLIEINRFLVQHSVSREELQPLLKNALVSPQQTAYFLTERLCWFTIIGTVVGARLGEVFFYNWPYYVQYPLDIFKVWQGGLASHGGVIGVVISLYVYLRYVQKWVPQLNFLTLLDFVAIPSALVAVFIRLGNFMNQEILGTQTTLPWGIIFGHPEDRSAPVPRHPVQLYEAMAYLITFCLLFYLWKKEKTTHRAGRFIGLLFICIFSSRFVLEFWKSFQEASVSFSYLQMGQLLSLPFIAVGFWFWFQSTKNNSLSQP